MRGSGQGKLGVVYEPGSLNLLSLAAAVVHRWPLVWIVDGRTSPAEARLLHRFGEVVDLEGLDPGTAAERVAASGVGGLTAFADGCLIQMADLSDRLGLVGNSRTTAEALINKFAERQALAAHGVPVPGFCRCDATTTLAEMAERLAGIRYPAVVKPAVGVGGRHVVAAVDHRAAIDEITARRAAGDRGTILVEECLGAFPPVPRNGLGDYLSVELVTLEARHQVVAVTGRMPLAPPFRETGSFIPALVSDDEYEAACEMAFAAATALGVVVGCLHVEIKLTADGPRVIEVNGRNGGGGIPQILVDIGAANPFYCAAAVAMGVDPNPVAPRGADRIGYAFAVQSPMNRPARLADGWRRQLHTIPGVARLEVRAEEWTARQSEGAYNYLVMVGGTVPDVSGLLTVYETVNGFVEML